MNIEMKNGHVVINGASYTGKNIQIEGSRVVVDGEVQKLPGDVNELSILSIAVHGDVEKLELTSGSVTAHSVGSIQTSSGDIECTDVSGSVSTMSGDVHCRTVHGSVSTMSGDIIQR